jgi:DNA-binding NtrC family response regulator
MGVGVKKYRILFVDDEASVRKALGDYFAELGHEVYRAASGQEALGLFEQVRPHVTVLDLKMPVMSGMEVLEVLRKKNAVVIMLTGHGEIETAVQAMRLGAENFLQKPIDMPHLVAAVEKAAEKADLREENLELRARLHPNFRRRVTRAAIFVVLVGAAVWVGSMIGAASKPPAAKPIPVPLTGDTSTKAPAPPLYGGDSVKK